MTQINPFDGSIAGAADIAFEKVHLRGLDNLDNHQLRNYMSTYFDSPHFQKIEWIDDTSANFVYATASAASEALTAFSNTDLVDISQLDTLALRPGKPLQITRDSGAIEEHQIQLRQATTSDVKKKRAHESSRYYLLHPEKDPREQRTREKRDRIHRNVENGDYKKMNFDDRERKRRRDEEVFDESMYDDDAGGVQSADDDDRRKRVRFGRKEQRDLFDRRKDGRLRDRSASPMRGDGDGRFGFGSDPHADARRRPVRQRSFSPARRGSNVGKELFATRKTLAPAANIELFPNKAVAPAPLSGGSHSHSSSMELFPDKVRKSHHRRSGAIDASPQQPTGHGHDRPRTLADRITGPSNMSGRPSTPGGSLADRITPRDGSLADRISRDGEDDNISIRGSSSSGLNIRGNNGLSIKGRAETPDDFSIRGAGAGGSNGGVKELFPVKTGSAGNAGKELFGEKLKGRGLARRTAASYY